MLDVKKKYRLKNMCFGLGVVLLLLLIGGALTYSLISYGLTVIFGFPDNQVQAYLAVGFGGMGMLWLAAIVVLIIAIILDASFRKAARNASIDVLDVEIEDHKEEIALLIEKRDRKKLDTVEDLKVLEKAPPAT